jgi:hypothetical protein
MNAAVGSKANERLCLFSCASIPTEQQVIITCCSVATTRGTCSSKLQAAGASVQA